MSQSAVMTSQDIPSTMMNGGGMMASAVQVAAPPVPLRHPSMSTSRSSQHLNELIRAPSYGAPSYTQHQQTPTHASQQQNMMHTQQLPNPKRASGTGLTSSTSHPGNLNALLPAQSMPTNSFMSNINGGNNFEPSPPPSMPHHHHHSSNNGVASSPTAAPLTTKPAIIEFGNYRFCVHDAPTDSNLPSYIEFLTKKRVVALVRACEPTYNKAPLTAANIRVVELPFQDGSPPPDGMITLWLQLVQEIFGPPTGGTVKKEKEKKKDATNTTSSSTKSTGPAIAIHCVAGLGRAPVLVCIALIEAGMTWMQAVELVRKKRRGALNITQLQYLEKYVPRGKKDSCTIM